MATLLLPSAREFLTALFDGLPTAPPPPFTPPANPLLQLPPKDRGIFVTLHCLFPNDFVPALDLLDRGLVTKIVQIQSTSRPNDDGLARGGLPPAVYYVRSSQPQSRGAAARFRHREPVDDSQKSYEVRLDSWNCSCPAFAFAAFSRSPEAGLLARDLDGVPVPLPAAAAASAWTFGGLSLPVASGEDPVCKHLLACLLAERCRALFDASGMGYVKEKRVSKAEMAGLAAGWNG
jgi:hypothetical protein